MMLSVDAMAVTRGLAVRLLLVTSAQDTGARAGDHPVPAVPVSAVSAAPVPRRLELQRGIFEISQFPKKAPVTFII